MTIANFIRTGLPLNSAARLAKCAKPQLPLSAKMKGTVPGLRRN